jgi:hypothetical protein
MTKRQGHSTGIEVKGEEAKARKSYDSVESYVNGGRIK